MAPAALAPQVELLSAGEAPRQPLRYQLQAGRQERLRLELALAMAAQVGQEGGGQAAPPLVLDIVAGPTEKVGADRLRYRLQVRKASLQLTEAEQAAHGEAIERDLALLRQLGGSVEVDTRGLTHHVALDVPSAPISPRFRSMLGNIRTALFSVPLPVEAVGVGARWRAKRIVDLQAFQVEQEVTYTLTALQGPRGTLQVTVRQSAAPQRLEDPKSGAQASLQAYETSGVGSVRFHLGHLTPVSEADVSSILRASLPKAEGQAVPLQVHMLSKVQVYPEYAGSRTPTVGLRKAKDDSDSAQDSTAGTPKPATAAPDATLEHTSQSTAAP